MKSILLVDDAVLTRDAYAILLEWAGYRTLVAGNGQEACEIALAEMPDLIVMDLNMPVMNGWTAARVLQGNPQTARIPLIAVSASLMTPADRARMEASGFAAVWTKPLPPSELLEGIRPHVTSEVQAA